MTISPPARVDASGGPRRPPPLGAALLRSRGKATSRFCSTFSSGDPPVGAEARIADEGIEHATADAMAIEDQDDDTRLYLGPSRSADLLEVVTIVREVGSELAIHAMKMRAKYRRLLPGG